VPAQSYPVPGKGEQESGYPEMDVAHSDNDPLLSKIFIVSLSKLITLILWLIEARFDISSDEEEHHARRALQDAPGNHEGEFMKTWGTGWQILVHLGQSKQHKKTKTREDQSRCQVCN
jgi:hypothetical protein